MPLFLSKHERRDNTDRDAMANAALDLCRATRALDGIRSARFYWANTDTIGLIVDAEAGAFGQGSGQTPSPAQAKAFFALSDLARPTSSETWGEAGAGAEMYRAATS